MRQTDPCWMPHSAWVFGATGAGATRSEIAPPLALADGRSKKKKKSISDNCEVLLLKISYVKIAACQMTAQVSFSLRGWCADV